MTATREKLSLLLDELSEDEIEDVLDYVRWLESAEDTLTEAELEAVRAGEEEIRRGEVTSLAELRRSFCLQRE